LAVQQLSNRRVRFVGGDEHFGRGGVAEGGSHQGLPGSVPPPAWGDIEQVDEVAAVEVAWPEDKEACDLAALHGHQAVLVLDESLDLPWGAGSVAVSACP
jgi:hypothetical protein